MLCDVFFTDMIEHWTVLRCVCCVVWWYGRFSFLWWRVIKSSSMIVCYFSFENWRNLQYRVSTPVRICIVRLHTIWYPWHFVQLNIFPIQTYFQTLSLSSTDTNKHTHTTNMHTRTHTNYKPLTHVHTNMPHTHTHTQIVSSSEIQPALGLSCIGCFRQETTWHCRDRFGWNQWSHEGNHSQLWNSGKERWDDR